MANRLSGPIQTILVFVLLLSPHGLFGQKKESDKATSAKDQTTFKVSTSIVVVNATVTDKDGHSVKDLTAKDVRVYDDGKLQAIETFALESYRPRQIDKSALRKDAAVADKTNAPDFTRPRMISLIIDDIASNPEDRFFRVVEAVKKYIETDMGPADQIAIISLSGQVQYPFSDDKQILLDEVASLQRKLNWNPGSTSFARWTFYANHLSESEEANLSCSFLRILS